MTKATKRISRERITPKSSLKFPVTATAREFHQRYKRAWSEGHRHIKALPENAPRKQFREALAKDQAACDEHKAWVLKYLARFYKADECAWHKPKPLKSMADIVELAVAGLEDVGASRALSVAIIRAAGLKI